MITIETISKTKCYKSLDHIQKVMMGKKVNLIAIDLGLKMSALRGFDFWVGNTSPNNRVKEIVKELLE